MGKVSRKDMQIIIAVIVQAIADVVIAITAVAELVRKIYKNKKSNRHPKG